jgi:hypothetical protein
MPAALALHGVRREHGALLDARSAQVGFATKTGLADSGDNRRRVTSKPRATAPLASPPDQRAANGNDERSRARRRRVNILRECSESMEAANFGGLKTTFRPSSP